MPLIDNYLIDNSLIDGFSSSEVKSEIGSNIFAASVTSTQINSTALSKYKSIKLNLVGGKFRVVCYFDVGVVGAKNVAKAHFFLNGTAITNEYTVDHVQGGVQFWTDVDLKVGDTIELYVRLTASPGPGVAARSFSLLSNLPPAASVIL